MHPLDLQTTLSSDNFPTALSLFCSSSKRCEKGNTCNNICWMWKQCNVIKKTNHVFFPWWIVHLGQCENQDHQVKTSPAITIRNLALFKDITLEVGRYNVHPIKKNLADAAELEDHLHAVVWLGLLWHFRGINVDLTVRVVGNGHYMYMYNFSCRTAILVLVLYKLW